MLNGQMTEKYHDPVIQKFTATILSLSAVASPSYCIVILPNDVHGTLPAIVGKQSCPQRLMYNW